MYFKIFNIFSLASSKKTNMVLAWLAVQGLFFIGLFIEGARRITRRDNADALFVYNASIGLGKTRLSLVNVSCFSGIWDGH